MMYLIPRLLFRSCLFGLFISLAGANVSLEIVDGKTSFDEGSDVQLLCTISPYHGSMTWFVDNVHYAGCLQNTCNPFPNKPYTFEYTFNESKGQFKLIIVSVNSSHANLLFACDDGNERKSVSFNVTPVNVSDGGWCKLWLLFLLLLIPIVIFIVICCCCCRKGYCYNRNIKVILNIESMEPTANNCYIQWDLPTSENLHLQYMLEYCLAEDNDWIKYGEILNTQKTCLESLRPGKKYKIRVYAIYESKVIYPPGIEEFATTLDAPESRNRGRNRHVEQWNTQEHNPKSHLLKVSEVRANYDITVNRCDITWNVERSGKPLSDKIQYMLEYTLNNGREWNKQGIILDEPETCLESLERNKYYEIHVYAIYQSFIQEVPGKGYFSTRSQSSNPLPPIKQSEGRHQAGASVHKLS